MVYTVSLVTTLIVVFCCITHSTSGKSVGQLQCQQRIVQKNLYVQLHDTIAQNLCSRFAEGMEHIELLNKGIPLQYDKFNPKSHYTRFEEWERLPQFVIENGLPLVDRVFPLGLNKDTIKANNSHTMKDYHFESLSSTYDYVLTHTITQPRNISDEDILRAKYYLQELVPNPERVFLNKTALPRFILYDFYRMQYLKEKEIKNQAAADNRAALTQQAFENWGQKHLPTLESNADAAFNKWQIFGYKSEVEKQLQYLDVDTHEDKLVTTRALFRSMGRRSSNDHKTIYPFSFEPVLWFQTLKASQPESSDQLRFRISILLAQRALLNATTNELNGIANEDVMRTLQQIKVSLNNLHEMVRNAVGKVIEMEVQCFTRVNLTVCGEIINGHTAFRHLLQEIAEHFNQVSYLESLVNGRSANIQTLREKISEVDSDLKLLEIKFNAAKIEEGRELAEDLTSVTMDATSCPENDKTHFMFDSHSEEFDLDTCNEFCHDSRVPINTTKRPLWNLNSCSVDNELAMFNIKQNFSSLMNSAPAKLRITLSKVNIHRSWFDTTILKDSRHYTFKHGRGKVSPGMLNPSSYFNQVAESGQYIMPQYVSSLILANNVTIFFPGLGAWNDTDDDNDTNEVINILMKYTYAANIDGGYGPIMFTPASLNRNTHKFRLERKNGGILISLSGGQLIAFINTVIPKFPRDQEDPPDPVICDDKDHPAEQRKRRRRSISDEKPHLSTHLNMRELAMSLFSNRNENSELKVAKVNDMLDELQEKAHLSQEKVRKFLDIIEQNDIQKPAISSVLPTAVYGDKNLVASSTYYNESHLFTQRT